MDGIVELQENEIVNYDDLLGSASSDTEEIFQSKIFTKEYGLTQDDYIEPNQTIEDIVVDNHPNIEESKAALENSKLYINDTDVPKIRKETKNEDTNEIDALNNLHTALNNVTLDKLNILNKNLGSENINDSSSVKLPRGLQLDFSSLQRVLSLENSISDLEGKLGINELENSNENKSITLQINELYRHLRFLEEHDEQKLDKFQDRLQKLDAEYVKVAMGNGLNDQETKVNELYDMYKKVEMYGPVLKPLTERVRDVSRMNDRVVDTLEIVKSMEQDVNEMSVSFKQWSQTLDEIDSKIDLQNDVMKDNMKDINKRIEELILNR